MEIYIDILPNPYIYSKMTHKLIIRKPSISSYIETKLIVQLMADDDDTGRLVVIISVA